MPIREEGLEDDMPRKIFMELVVDPGQDLLRIDKFLFSKMEKASRSKIQEALEKGDILLNGAEVKANHKIKPNDHILVYDTRQAESTEVLPEDIDLDIVFEDEEVLVINKKAGMVVHPGSGNYSGTLVNALSFYLKKNEQELPRIGLVHRIDKDTTGLVVVAKNEDGMQQLAAQFKKHTVHRRYIALVWGDVLEEQGTIEMNVGRHQRLRKIMTTYPDGEHGKHAVTHYKVLERFYYVTLIELHLETGRTHQIRAHMKHLGHPLFNDATYGGDKIMKGTVFSRYKQFVENCFSILPRQALHAKELGFIHPQSKEDLKFDSELPKDFVQVIERWRTYIQGLSGEGKAALEKRKQMSGAKDKSEGEI